MRFVTIVVPYSGKTPPKIKAQIIGKPEIGASKIGLKISGDWGSRKISYEIPKL